MNSSISNPDAMKSGRAWAVLIGVDSYHESFGDVEFASEDCRRLHSVLQLPEFGFEPQNILMLTDDSAYDRRPTYGNIHSWLDTWLDRPAEGDTIVVYFAGHGRSLDGSCYLAPCDATLPSLKRVGIQLSDVQELLEKCRASKKLLIVDACHSGAGRDILAMSLTMESAFSDASKTDIYTLTSCGTDEISHPMKEKQQGVFSHFLVQALSGHCPADTEGRLTLAGVYDWVREKVEGWASEKRCKQSPRCFGQRPDQFIIGTPGEHSAPMLAEVVDTPPVRTAAKPIPHTPQHLEETIVIPPPELTPEVAQPVLAQPVPSVPQPLAAVEHATAVQEAIAPPEAQKPEQAIQKVAGRFVTFILALGFIFLALLALSLFAWIGFENIDAPPERNYPEIPHTAPEEITPPSESGIPYDPILFDEEELESPAWPIQKQDDPFGKM